MFDDIVIIADTLEENDAILPEGYKSFLLLTNGYRNHGTEIFALVRITLLDFPDDYRGYFAIGSYIGDESSLPITKGIFIMVTM